MQSNPPNMTQLLDLVSDGAALVTKRGEIRWINRAGRDCLAIASPYRPHRLPDFFTQPERIELLLAANNDAAKSAAASSKPQLALATVSASGTDVMVTIHALDDARSELVAIFRPLHAALTGFDRTISFATRDPVTQLINYDTYQEAVAEMLESACDFGVICAEIDQFTAVNETFGHAEGDQLLRAVAMRLRAALPTGTALARIYGGRFSALIAGGELPTRLTEVAATMHRAMAPVVSVAGWQRPITLSIGIVSWPQARLKESDIVSAAESALWEARRFGGGETRLFQPEMLADRREKLAIEADLRLALDRGELSLHYQPKVNWPGRDVKGFEALLRWNHPERGAVSPARFIPIAESSGLILRIGQWVIEETCRQLAEWRAFGKQLVPVAVNVSPQQILARPLEEILEPLDRYGIAKNWIEIEITETAVMEKLQYAELAISSLRAAGLRLAIDDFGTGHSSLGNLRRLPIDTLKIDRSFIIDIESSKPARDIVATIMAMAQALSLNVVAEGVETEAQAEFLEGLGTQTMQGYLFAKAMPSSEAARLLKQAADTQDLNFISEVAI
jgi:diguanylate cyclase (GGDEF)-like protein